MKVAISDTGTVTAGTSMARKSPRNMKITSTTRPAAISRVLYTSAMALSINMVLSKLCFSAMPVGRVALMRSRSARTRCDTSSALAVLCLIKPRPTMDTPLPRNRLRHSAGPTSTRATSPSLTR